MRLCAVSVDLDEIPNYFAIHGLPDPQGPARTLVYDVAFDRLSSLGRELAIPLTWFAVGSDLARAANAQKVRSAAEAGFEVADHSLDHRYDLVRLGRAEIARQIEQGARAIEHATGTCPVGFRAPGYTISDEVFDVLTEMGIEYDSSVFPCPPYWLAKTLKMGLIAARGHRSRSIVDTPLVLTSPTQPYRIGRPYWRPGRGLLEIPVQVTRGPRLPIFGTTLTLWGSRVARWLARACIGQPMINLELHGIDVLDVGDGLQDLRSVRADVRVAHGEKLDALRAAVDVLKRAGYEFVTLKSAARALSSRWASG